MTGLELLRNADTTAGEIADIVSEHCPPVTPGGCDRLSCRACWLAWLTKGEPPKEKGPSDKQTAPGEEGLHPNLKEFLPREGRIYKVTILGIKFLGEYYFNQELVSHIGERVLVERSSDGYEAFTTNGVYLGALTPRRHEDQ